MSGPGLRRPAGQQTGLVACIAPRLLAGEAWQHSKASWPATLLPRFGSDSSRAWRRPGLLCWARSCQFRSPGSPARQNGYGNSIDRSPRPNWCEPSLAAMSCAGAKNLLGQHIFGEIGAYMTGRRLSGRRLSAPSQRRTGPTDSGLTYLGPATHTLARVDAVR